LECAQLAAAPDHCRISDSSLALDHFASFDSGSKLRALQTLRAVRLRLGYRSLRFCWDSISESS